MPILGGKSKSSSGKSASRGRPIVQDGDLQELISLKGTSIIRFTPCGCEVWPLEHARLEASKNRLSCVSLLVCSYANVSLPCGTLALHCGLVCGNLGAAQRRNWLFFWGCPEFWVTLFFWCSFAHLQPKLYRHPKLESSYQLFASGPCLRQLPERSEYCRGFLWFRGVSTP